MPENIESVESIIQRRRQTKNHKLKRRIVKTTILFVVHAFLAFGGYTYFTSSTAKTRDVSLSGNHLISRQEVMGMIESVSQPVNLLDFGVELSRPLEDHPLVASVSLDYRQANRLIITLQEYEALAYYEAPLNAVLLENGSLYPIDGLNESLTSDLPLISGYADVEGQKRLADALVMILPSTRLLISEITQDALSYDNYYAHLYMQDGIQVMTGLGGLKILDDYYQIISALNPEHDCIAIDETTGVPYSFPCSSQ